MQVPNSLTDKKTILIEILILAAVLGAGYYGYVTLFNSENVTKQVTVNEELLGGNFIEFIKVTKKDKISFSDRGFLDSVYVTQLQDFSEIISPNATRGRLDPFLPYASSRPLR